MMAPIAKGTIPTPCKNTAAFTAMPGTRSTIPTMISANMIRVVSM